MSGGVILVGASGLAREVLASGANDVVGILDDDPALTGTTVAGVPVLGAIELAAECAEQFLVCVGPSRSRRAVVRRLEERGVNIERFATYIAPTARIGGSCTIARGAVVLDCTVVTADAHIGAHTVIMPNCTVTHDDVLESFVTLAAGVALGGGVRIGEAAYIGMNASVRQGVDIGAGATIGMGAAVLSDVPDDDTWFGVPARPRDAGGRQ